MRASNRALRDITNDKHNLSRKYENSKAKANKIKHRNEQLETECAQLELNLLSDGEDSDSDNSFHANDESILQDIIGHHKYSPEIRKMYYSLLADQVPVSKITEISFNPSLNMEELRLPKKTCAGYMRKEELKTISDAHKAHVLCKDASEGRGICLNTDGTTKQQKKVELWSMV